MLKARQDILDAVGSRFDASLALVSAREALCAAGPEQQPRPTWPLRVALGRPRADELATNMAAVSTYVTELRDWQRRRGFDVVWSERRVGSTQEIPTHVVVGDIDVAARMLGASHARRLDAARTRARAVHASFPALTDLEVASVLRQTRAWSDIDFELLMDAGTWFETNDATGLTPRQVPLAGFHAKWLNARGRRSLVCLLAGTDDLGLVDTAPQVELAWCDPAHLARGGRRYDSHVLGDVASLPYEVRVALIVENKDTYRYFPPTAGAVCIFGAGAAGAAHVARIPWIAEVGRLVYWGDMDADGLVILNSYREQGLAVESMLMDMAAYERYERFGTSLATGKQALDQRARRDLTHLEPGERELYDHLTDPGHARHRRIEQERIPLENAHAALQALLG